MFAVLITVGAFGVGFFVNLAGALVTGQAMSVATMGSFGGVIIRRVFFFSGEGRGHQSGRLPLGMSVPIMMIHGRLQPLVNAIGATECVGHAGESANGGQECQHDQRSDNHPRLFFQVALGVLVGAVFTEEGERHQSEHVKRGEQCTEESHGPQALVSALPYLPENLVLAEESGEGWDTRDGHRGN